MPEQKKLPDADGWWARCESSLDGRGRVKWFEVRLISDSGDPPLEPHIFVADIGQHQHVKWFSTPLTLWYGPVVVPTNT